jgi:drug/metabolite transporter (DMT)-like permease
MLNELLYFTSNIILTLYGVLIKGLRGTELVQQILFRAVAFILITLFASGVSNPFTVETMTLSVANFLSIYGIYYAFQNMPLSLAQTVFYSWPIFYYLWAKEFSFGRLVILATIFTLITFITNPTLTLPTTKTLLPLLGVVVSIATHIAIFIYFKRNTESIASYLYKQYIWILIGLIVYYFVSGSVGRTELISKQSAQILLFNVVLGYLGFYLQFRGVKALPNYTIGILSFLAILVSVLIDHLFFDFTISGVQWVLIVAILVISSYYRIT